MAVPRAVHERIIEISDEINRITQEILEYSTSDMFSEKRELMDRCEALSRELEEIKKEGVSVKE